MRWIIAGAGAIAAAFAGAAAGGVIKPEFGSLVGQLSAPRLVTASAGRRAAAEAETAPDAADANTDDASFDGNLPDYVVGTDWLPPKFEEDAPPADAGDIAPVQVLSAASPAPAARTKVVQPLAAGKALEPLRTAPSALVADAAAKAKSAF
ncbi:hypothetical protein [Phenylobacterium sp.]|uniref:hypothetical protein n=1 Tax=Phenylobacterium sp. TaxID=1871053 RepID=UPI0035B4334B